MKLAEIAYSLHLSHSQSVIHRVCKVFPLLYEITYKHDAIARHLVRYNIRDVVAIAADSVASSLDMRIHAIFRNRNDYV